MSREHKLQCGTLDLLVASTTKRHNKLPPAHALRQVLERAGVLAAARARVRGLQRGERPRADLRGQGGGPSEQAPCVSGVFARRTVRSIYRCLYRRPRRIEGGFVQNRQLEIMRNTDSFAAFWCLL